MKGNWLAVDVGRLTAGTLTVTAEAMVTGVVRVSGWPLAPVPLASMTCDPAVADAGMVTVAEKSPLASALTVARVTGAVWKVMTITLNARNPPPVIVMDAPGATMVADNVKVTQGLGA